MLATRPDARRKFEIRQAKAKQHLARGGRGEARRFRETACDRFGLGVQLTTISRGKASHLWPRRPRRGHRRWCPPRLARCARRRACLRAAPDRTVDAPECNEGAAEATREAEGRRRTVGHRRQHSRPRFRGRPSEPEVAGRLHLHWAEGWLYVAVVLDLFSRRVVGWSMKADRDASLVMDALMMAVWRRGKADALLHHSDQGSQYTSKQFQRLLLDHGITCSMSRAGNATRQWRDRSRPNGPRARSTAPAMPPAPMCSTTSSASTIQSDAIPS